jgi:hypothetical protein
MTWLARERSVVEWLEFHLVDISLEFHLVDISLEFQLVGISRTASR